MERVGIYNRCSTEEESQRNALAAQVLESREIAEKKGWEIREQYVESETGTVACKRSEYQRLLSDMDKGRFDIIMIKSIDRLMRSAKDWYFFLNRLTENKLRLYIYIEGKFYTPDDNLISGIKAILAEDFSRELSKKIKNAHRRRQEKRSGYNITCEMFGWNKVAKDVYEINEEEAECYRWAFSLAREGKGFYTISNELYEMGARGKKGQKISEVQWRKMLYSPRAHGTVILNTRTYNFDTKKYEEVPESGWIIMENALPPIVTKEYQEEVIKIMKEKAVPVRRCQKTVDGNSINGNNIICRKYGLTRKLKCAECGRYYYRTSFHTREGKKAVWKCATFLESGRAKGGENPKGCDNINIAEEKLIQCVGALLEKHYEEIYGRFEGLYEEVMEALGKILKGQKGDGELKRLTREQTKLMARKDMLMEKLLSGVITDEDYKKYHSDILGNIRKVEDKINGIKQSRLQYNNYEARHKKIGEAVKAQNLIYRAKIGEFLKEIDYIEVHKDGRLIIIFDLEGTCREEVWYATKK